MEEKNLGTQFEDALEDARNLAAFLQNVAAANGLHDSHDMVFNTSYCWAGYALCHSLLVEKLEVMAESYYVGEGGQADTEKPTAREGYIVIPFSGTAGDTGKGGEHE